MAMLGIDGFDHYNSASDLVNQKATTTRAFQWTSARGLGIGAGTNFFNYGKCITCNQNGDMVATLSASKTTAIWGGHVILPENSFLWISGFDSSAGQIPYANGNSQVGLLLNSSNASLSAYRDLALRISQAPSSGVVNTTAVLLAKSSNNIYPVDSVFLLEVAFTIDGSVGSVLVAINGTVVLNITGQNTQVSANSSMDSWCFQLGTPSGNVQIDNEYFLDSAVQSSGTNPFNTFQSAYGLTRVFTSFPVANSGSPAFTPLTSTNVSQVQETAMDGDTTYNYASSAGDEDLFTITPLPTGLTPLYCQVKLCGRQTSAGSLSMATILKSSTTTLAGDTIVSYQTYTYQADGTPVDPATAAAWTNAGVSAALIGYKEIA